MPEASQPLAGGEPAPPPDSVNKLLISRQGLKQPFLLQSLRDKIEMRNVKTGGSGLCFQLPNGAYFRKLPHSILW